MVLAISMMIVTSASAAIIYDHTFDEGGGALLGTAEDYSGVLWSNSTYETATPVSVFNADGTASSTGGMWLPVSIESGNQYVMTIGGVYGANWASMGFAENNNSAAHNNTAANGYAWCLVNNVNMSAWLGAKTSNSVFGNSNMGTSSTTNDVQIVLDTTSPLWSVTWSARASGDTAWNEMGSGTFTANPPINFAGIAANGTNTNDFNSFKLEVIPEPTTLGLISVSGSLFLIIRRRMLI